MSETSTSITTSSAAFSESGIRSPADDLLPAPCDPKAKFRGRGPTDVPKTFMTWAIFTIVAVAVFIVLKESPTDPGAPNAPSTWIPIALLLAFGTSVLGLFGFLFRRAKKKVHAYNVAAGLMVRGDYANAVKRLETVEKMNPKSGYVSALGNLSLGTGRVRLGLYAEAADAFSKAYYAYRSDGFVAALTRPAAYGLSTCFSLAGDLENAKIWLKQGSSYEGDAPFPVEELPHVILMLREGEMSAACAYLEENWNDLEAALSGKILREHRLLRAYAEVETGTQTIAEAVTGLRSILIADVAFLGHKWPDLRAFLQRLEDEGWGAAR